MYTRSHGTASHRLEYDLYRKTTVIVVESLIFEVSYINIYISDVFLSQSLVLVAIGTERAEKQSVKSDSE